MNLDSFDALRIDFFVRSLMNPVGGYRIMDSLTGQSLMGCVPHDSVGEPTTLVLDTPRYFGFRLPGNHHG